MCLLILSFIDQIMHVWLSGQKQWTHNPSPEGYHRFKPCCMHFYEYVSISIMCVIQKEYGKGIIILQK